MGSKGAATTTTNNNQAYTANAATSQAANQALTGAESAASQPFQMPVAPVAGFNDTQQQAFGEIGAAQGQAQPYYNQAAQDFSAGSTPISQSQIDSYYNPMAQNVTNQLQNIYGQQNQQNQGNLTAQAGGVGADRISVGMGNLANQQGLASGQIYSQLYQQALQAAQQQQQQTVQAGTNMAGLGTTAENTALQGAGQLGAAGSQQQQQTQAQLNAPYQNQLAQIAYQFQTPQYLAGIAGGLAPALGGTTIGGQNTSATPAQPSIAGQVLGAGTAGVGLYNGLKGSGSSPASNTGAISNSMNTLNNGTGGSFYGPGFAEGGATEDNSPAIPGITMPKSGSMEPIPMTSMGMGAGHSGPLTGGINFPQPQQQGQGESIGGDIGQALGLATKILPFLKRGGPVYPHYDDGGDVRDDPFNSDPVPSMAQIMSHSKGFPNPFSQMDPSMFSAGMPTFSEGSPSFKDRFNSIHPDMGAPPPAPAAGFAGSTLPQPRPAEADAAPYRMPDVKADGSPIAAPSIMKEDKTGGEEETPSKSEATSYSPPGGGGAARDASPYLMPQEKTPYPDSLKRDAGQDFARSPWMALVKAGAAMMSTPGSLGTGIGAGLKAATGSVENQRKELRSEQELNDKAQKLYQDAQVHLDKYNKMTPYEAASVASRNKEIDQAAPDTAGSAPKEIDVQRVMKSMSESLDPKYMGMPLDEKRRLAMQMLRPGTGGAAAPAAPAAGPPVGTRKEFDDGKGGKAIGVWDGAKWGPAQ